MKAAEMSSAGSNVGCCILLRASFGAATRSLMVTFDGILIFSLIAFIKSTIIQYEILAWAHGDSASSVYGRGRGLAVASITRHR